MLNVTFLKQLSEELSAILPQSLHETKAHFERQCQLVLKNAFADLGLVTREEFEIQKKVLERTRQQLDALNATLELLEKSIQSP